MRRRAESKQTRRSRARDDHHALSPSRAASSVMRRGRRRPSTSAAAAHHDDDDDFDDHAWLDSSDTYHEQHRTVSDAAAAHGAAAGPTLRKIRSQSAPHIAAPDAPTRQRSYPSFTASARAIAPDRHNESTDASSFDHRQATSFSSSTAQHPDADADAGAEGVSFVLQEWQERLETSGRGTFTSYLAAEMRDTANEAAASESRRLSSVLPRPDAEPAKDGDVPQAPTYRGRFTELEFWEIVEGGETHRRRLSKLDILNEARMGFSDSLPNPKRIGSWLVSVEAAPELLEFRRRMGFKPGDKGGKKLLKRYLKSALQLRDIRQVDPAFSAKSCLWVRHSAFVIVLEDVRAIVCHDRVYLFDPDGARTFRTLQILQQRLVRDSEIEDAFTSFELRALEGILVSVVTCLETDFVALEPALRSSLVELPRELTSSVLENIRSQQQKLNQYHARVEKVHRVLHDLLEEDDDMAAMYLTERHRNPDIRRNPTDHDEVEALLEAYLQVVDDLTTRAELLDQAVEDTEDLIGIHLDTLRNKLLMVQLSLAIVGMLLTAGGMVGADATSLSPRYS